MKAEEASGDQHVAAVEDDVRLFRQAVLLLVAPLAEIGADDQGGHRDADQQGQQVERLSGELEGERVGHIAGRQQLEVFGNGPTEAPPSTVSASPLKISMPASVTMKAGIL